MTGYATVEGNTIVSKGEVIKSQFGSWDDIDELRAFYIYINRYNSTATAYVNGRHQVPITIYIEALDKNGRIIKIAKEDIYRNTHIVNEKIFLLTAMIFLYLIKKMDLYFQAVKKQH